MSKDWYMAIPHFAVGALVVASWLMGWERTLVVTCALYLLWCVCPLRKELA